MASHSRSRSDPDLIRGKLLNRLGIYDVPATVQNGQPMTAAQVRRLRILRGMGVGHSTMGFSPPDGSATRPLASGPRFVEPLKSDDVRKPTPASKKATKKATKIAFQDQVEVLPIPTRYEYSDRIKSRIWSNRHELQENAERNALEFASEGWDWKQVKEDDHMFICSQSGELVHPVHLQHLMEQEEQSGPSLERGQPVHS